MLTWRNDCGLISGLFVQPGASRLLALMVIRRVGAHLRGGLCSLLVPRACPALPDPRSDRCCHHFIDSTCALCGVSISPFVASLCHRRGRGRGRARRGAHPSSLVWPAVRHQGPGRSSHLVGKRCNGHVLRSSRKQLLKPLRLVLGMCDHGTRAMDEQRSKVPVPSLAEVPDSRFASSAAMCRHKPQTCRELSPASPSAAVPQRGRQSRGAENSDTRHLTQVAGPVELRQQCGDLAVNLIDATLNVFERSRAVPSTSRRIGAGI